MNQKKNDYLFKCFLIKQMPMDPPCCIRAYQDGKDDVINKLLIILKKENLDKQLIIQLVKEVDSRFVELI